MSRLHHGLCTALVCIEPEYQSGCTATAVPELTEEHTMTDLEQIVLQAVHDADCGDPECPLPLDGHARYGRITDAVLNVVKPLLIPGGPTVIHRDAATGDRILGWEDLKATGLLWLINAAVFHPRGYAFGVVRDSEGQLIGWRLLGDGAEPWQFTDNCDAEFRAAEAFFATHRGREVPPAGGEPDPVQPSTSQINTARRAAEIERIKSLPLSADSQRMMIRALIDVYSKAGEVDAAAPSEERPTRLEFIGIGSGQPVVGVAHGVDCVALQLTDPTTRRLADKSFTMLVPDEAEALGEALIRQAHHARDSGGDTAR